MRPLIPAILAAAALAASPAVAAKEKRSPEEQLAKLLDPRCGPVGFLGLGQVLISDLAEPSSSAALLLIPALGPGRPAIGIRCRATGRQRRPWRRPVC